MRTLLTILLLTLFSTHPAGAKDIDFSQVQVMPDSVHATYVWLDEAAISKYKQYASSQSLLQQTNKIHVNDIEQTVTTTRNATLFFVLMVMIVLLTYLKVAFGKEMDELFQSLLNKNLGQQIFRSQRGEVSFSSLMLSLNFTVTMSLFVRFILMNYFHVHTFDDISATLILIFLFTFFYLIKIVAVKFIGAVFELKDECDEYVFNFTNASKIAGLTLLPALFIFYTVPVKYFDFIFVITCFIFIVLAILFVWRGLSTAYKLLYRSVYHFFIYVCVVEVSSVFLLFKLLTKTIN